MPEAAEIEIPEPVPLWLPGGAVRGPLAPFVEPRRVLDHGFVQLLDVMGSDEAIEEAARTSYAPGARPRHVRRSLIRYMMRHRHSSPFEMVEIKVRVCLPIVVERQWIRHRTANTNELSGRYSELPEVVYIPEASEVCYQSSENRQGRSGPVDPELAERVREDMQAVSAAAFASYREFRAANVSRETARMHLPLSTYTTKVWKIDGNNLLRFLSLRLAPDAQWEIREYAAALAEIVRVWLPLTWEAFVDYELEGARLSRAELRVIRELVACLPAENIKMLRARAMELGASGREASEFIRLIGSDPGAL